ncbi:MAG: ATP-binding protein, partial [Spirochaetaceae bacterium]|nr:ATP-binding protein [Spirochaetaceae bacterium]
MLLEIANIGKIQKASIEMRGITVLAGNNNTGKSTYGKILYCMVNAFCNADAAIHDERERNIADILFNSFPFFFPDRPTEKFMHNIMKHQSSEDELRGILKNAMGNESIDRWKDDITIVVEKLIRSGKVPDEQIMKTIVTRFLRSEFGDRIIHVNHAEEPGAISLKIKEKMLSVS